jgi:acetyltransferase-like isoleucine patch superfamily enzyme
MRNGGFVHNLIAACMKNGPDVGSVFMKPIQRFLDWGSTSKLVQLVVTLVAYSLYAAVLGASLAPAVFLAIAAFRTLALPALSAGALPPVGAAILFALSLGGSLYVFFFWGLILIGVLVRLLSLGIRTGRHPAISPVTVLWVILNGIFTIAFRMILPLVPMTFFSETFYRLCGMKLGRGAWINTFLIMDPYHVEIGDGTVVGGDAIISPHLYEAGFLLIERIRIGRRCLIGSNAYVSPGVTIGDGSVVGLRAYLRKGRTVPPGSRISSLAGLDSRQIRTIERAGKPGRTIG